MPVARRSSNPVTAPIQRWLFHSPGRFAAVIVGAVIVMGTVGAVVNPFTPSPNLTADGAPSGAPAKTVTMQAGDEVTANEVLAISPEEAAKSPQVTAMKFAVAYVDLSPNSGEWVRALSSYADSTGIGAAFIAARPNYPVTISGSTITNDPGPVITVNTSAGKLQATMGKSSSGAWKVLGPLPTLDAAAPPPAAPATGVAARTTVPASTTSSAPPSTVTVTVSATPSATPPPPAPPRPAAPVTTTAPPPRTQAPAPAGPRPGAIPIPSGLDGPLPGG